MRADRGGGCGERRHRARQSAAVAAAGGPAPFQGAHARQARTHGPQDLRVDRQGAAGQDQSGAEPLDRISRRADCTVVASSMPRAAPPARGAGPHGDRRRAISIGNACRSSRASISRSCIRASRTATRFSTAGATSAVARDRSANATRRTKRTPAPTASSTLERSMNRREPATRSRARRARSRRPAERSAPRVRLLEQPRLDGAALERGAIRDFVMEHHHGVARNEAAAESAARAPATAPAAAETSDRRPARASPDNSRAPSPRSHRCSACGSRRTRANTSSQRGMAVPGRRRIRRNPRSSSSCPGRETARWRAPHRR